MLNKWGDWARDRLDRHSFLFLISAAVLIVIFFWQLGALPLSGAERQAAASASSLRQIFNQPLNAPYKIIQHLLARLGSGGNFELRSASVLFGLFFVYCFYMILRFWFGYLSAWLGTLFFAATPFFILTSRTATATVTYLWPLVLIVAYMKLVRSRSRIFQRLAILAAAAALCVYQPGGLLLLIIAAIYEKNGLLRSAKLLSGRLLAAIILMFLIILAPAIRGVVQEPSILKVMLLLPGHLPGASESLKNFVWAVLAFFLHSRAHNQLQLGRLAILNIAQLILLVFGCYALWSRARLKVYVLAAILLLIVLAAALNQSYNFLLMGLPALSIVVTAGLRYLHLEWNSVFPRNPLPRGLAISLLIIVVCLHVVWGVHYSLTAWPHRLPIIQ